MYVYKMKTVTLHVHVTSNPFHPFHDFHLIKTQYHNMPQHHKQHYQIVSTWLQFTQNIQKRKYYTSPQLYQIFKCDCKIDISLINLITLKAFTRHLNSYSDKSDLFQKIKKGYPSKITYILIAPHDISTFDSHTLRISPRKRIHVAMTTSTPKHTINRSWSCCAGTI